MRKQTSGQLLCQKATVRYRQNAGQGIGETQEKAYLKMEIIRKVPTRTAKMETHKISLHSTICVIYYQYNML